MSKGNSGLFKNTKGFQNFQRVIQKSAYMEIIKTVILRTKGLDKTEHSLPYTTPSSKKMKEFKKKINSRTITKEEYQRYQWAKRFKKRRDDGVQNFWDQEKARLLRSEKGTRNWTKKQKADILNNIRPTFKGKVIAGHHTYSASKYPQLANLGEIIYPATFREHLYGWHGGRYKLSLPGKPLKVVIEF